MGYGSHMTHSSDSAACANDKHPMSPLTILAVHASGGLARSCFFKPFFEGPHRYRQAHWELLVRPSHDGCDGVITKPIERFGEQWRGPRRERNKTTSTCFRPQARRSSFVGYNK